MGYGFVIILLASTSVTGILIRRLRLNWDTQPNKIPSALQIFGAVASTASSLALTPFALAKVLPDTFLIIFIIIIPLILVTTFLSGNILEARESHRT